MNVLVVLVGALTDLLLQSEHKTRVYDALLYVYEEAYRKPVDFVYGEVRLGQDAAMG